MVAKRHSKIGIVGKKKKLNRSTRNNIEINACNMPEIKKTIEIVQNMHKNSLISHKRQIYNKNLSKIVANDHAKIGLLSKKVKR